MRMVMALLICTFLSLPLVATFADQWPTEILIPDAMAVRLNDSALNLFAGIFSEFIIVEMIEDILIASNPVFDESIGGDMFSATVNVTGVDFRYPIDLSLDSEADNIALTGILYELVIYVHVNGHIFWVPFESDGFVSADRVTVKGDVDFSVDQNNYIHVNISNVLASIFGFEIHIDGFPDELIGLFEETIKNVIKEVVEQAIRDQIPAALEEFINELPFENIIEIFGMELHIDVFGQDFVINNSGTTVWMKGDVYPGSVDSCVPEQYGSEYTSSQRPDFTNKIPGTTRTYMMGISIADDTLNRALLAGYHSGIMCWVLDPDTLEQLGVPIPLTSGIFAAAVPRLNEIAVNAPLILVLRPQIAPIVKYRNPNSSYPISMSMEQFEIDVYMLAWERFLRLFTLDVNIENAELDAVITLDNKIHLIIGEELIVSNDVIFDELLNLTPEEEENVELVLPTLIEMILPLLTEAIEEFPLPEIEGFALDVIDIQTHGDNWEYLGIFGNLRVIETPLPISR